MKKAAAKKTPAKKFVEKVEEAIKESLGFPAGKTANTNEGRSGASLRRHMEPAGRPAGDCLGDRNLAPKSTRSIPADIFDGITFRSGAERSKALLTVRILDMLFAEEKRVNELRSLRSDQEGHDYRRRIDMLSNHVNHLEHTVRTLKRSHAEELITSAFFPYRDTLNITGKVGDPRE